MNKKTLFKCPVCSKALIRSSKQYFCHNGHCFDISRRGYVNLLLPGHKGAGSSGDSAEMLQSRREFLNKGYYEAFSDSLNNMVSRHLHYDKAFNILDAGCGEGYYIYRLKKDLESRFCMDGIGIYGIDVSKPAVHYASGRDKAISLAVASTYHIPIINNSLDCILCIFAPRDENEFRRVLKRSGKLIVAAPGPRHLYSFKTHLYDSTGFIGPKGTAGNGFMLLEHQNISYDIHLSSSEEIMHLFMMTPYSRHACDIKSDTFRSLSSLKVEVDINLFIYTRQ